MKPINTFQILKRIPDVSEDEVKAVTSAISHINDVATKSDINELRTEMKVGMTELKFSVVRWNAFITSLGLMKDEIQVVSFSKTVHLHRCT